VIAEPAILISTLDRHHAPVPAGGRRITIVDHIARLI
jgi:hypothetical protein